MQALAKLILGPGEFVVGLAGVADGDHRLTIRMLVNALFWGTVGIVAVALVA